MRYANAKTTTMASSVIKARVATTGPAETPSRLNVWRAVAATVIMMYRDAAGGRDTATAQG
jgi:hypothetical protein